MGDADEYFFRRLLTAVDRIDDAIVKMMSHFLPAGTS
jgi:hypothetical protein